MEVLDAIKRRRSVRAYSSRPIPADVLDRMHEALRFAPSACNLQPWHFIGVTDAELRGRLAAAANNQHWMADAPLTMVACGFPQRAYQRMGGYGNSVDVDLAIALDHLTLAAVADGLGTCWIGAFDEQKVKDLLGIPASVKVVAMTPVGYPASQDLIHPVDQSRRKPLEAILSTDRYTEPKTEAEHESR